MPQSLTYPGVYPQEDLSGPRPIQGIQPSITAFIGRTRKGPVGNAVTVNNFGEFVSTFGGYWSESWLPESVRDFFLNGGGTAVVVRAVHIDATDPAKRTLTAVRATAALDFILETGKPAKALKHKITLTARDPGMFMNTFRMRVTRGGTNSQGAAVPRERFTLEITTLPAADGSVKVVESFTNQDMSTLVAAVRRGSLLVDAKVADPGTASAMPKDEDLYEPLTKPFDGGKDGDALEPEDYTAVDIDPELAGAFQALEPVDLFSLMVVPPTRPTALATGKWTSVMALATRIAVDRRAFLIVDGPEEWNLVKTPVGEMNVGWFGAPSPNAALYTPWAAQPGTDGSLVYVPPSGAIAGVYARTEPGVWKAPAGVDAAVFGAVAPSRILTKEQNGALNIKGINCLMRRPNRPIVVWGTRTEEGFDGSGSLFRYVPVRRLFLFVEETLFRNTEWVVFRENDETLWFQVKASIEAFLHGLFLKGAFQGDIPEQAYYVECGWSTMTQADIDNGIINIVVGIAPVKPAEFVVLTFRHIKNTV